MVLGAAAGGTVAILLTAVALGPASVARAASAEQQLADRYAPIVALKQQDAACDTKGEAYRPVPVETVLGRPDVRLERADGTLITTAPTAADLFGRGAETYLDFPGTPLKAGCTYERWFKQIAAGAPTTAYAKVLTESGTPAKLALQYWLYYPFNDWNNKHESDWEMIQVMFDAASASAALTTHPTEVGFSQHEGGERAAWTSAKLSKDGDHPVVYPGSGSHANYFTSALWLGHSAQEGFGCDDTRGPSRRERTHAVLMPATTPTSPGNPFAWLTYDGHWGQKAGGPNTGPTGPNTKRQWTEPVSWAHDSWRAESTQVPAGGSLGASATSVFCAAVAGGSAVYLRFLRTPWFVLGVLALVALAAGWISRRTRWSPAHPLPIDQSRSGGEILRAGWRLYRVYWPLFLGIGLIFIPLSVLAALLQGALFSLTPVGALVDVARNDPIITAVIALTIGSLSTIVATVLVTAASADAVDRLDEGEHPDALDAYRGIRTHVAALGWAWLRILAITGLLTLTVIGIPIAIVYLVRRSVVTEACVIEELPATASLKRSARLVTGESWRVFVIAAFVNTTALLLGPLLGITVMLLTSSSLFLINVTSSLVYVIVMPYVGIALSLLLYDLRTRNDALDPSTA